MAPLFTIVCFLFLVMEILLGMVANGSIVLIHFIDWLRNRKLSPIDLILISLGLSRLLLQAVMILASPLLSNTVSMITSIWIFTNTLNLWFTACLSVFYLTKIAIFSHPVFLQLKQQFSGMVPWLLLGSVVYSVVVTITVSTSWNDGLSICNNYQSLLSNRSNAKIGTPPVCRDIMALVLVFNFFPFMVFLSSSILLISSLWKHVRCVQRNGTGTRDLNTQAHLSAIKALASFMVLYLISVAALSLKPVLKWNHLQIWVNVVFNVSAVYPSGHAIILIVMNPKLKQAWIRMVHHLKCCLSKVPP